MGHLRNDIFYVYKFQRNSVAQCKMGKFLEIIDTYKQQETLLKDKCGMFDGKLKKG